MIKLNLLFKSKKMEISDTNLSIFYVSRFFGLAPYLIKRNSKGKIVDFRSNVLLLIYSVCLFATIGEF